MIEFDPTEVRSIDFLNDDFDGAWIATFDARVLDVYLEEGKLRILLGGWNGGPVKAMLAMPTETTTSDNLPATYVAPIPVDIGMLEDKIPHAEES